MATNRISGAQTSGVTISQTNSNARRPAPASGEERSRVKPSQAQSNSRHVINIDGKSFDRHAPRGTYLNIVA